jgi:hypothetical protein
MGRLARGILTAVGGPSPAFSVRRSKGGDAPYTMLNLLSLQGKARRLTYNGE